MDTIYLGNEFSKEKPISITTFKAKKTPPKKKLPGSYFLKNKETIDKARLKLDETRGKYFDNICPVGKIRNPNTNRCVKRNSKKGQQILQGKLPPKKSPKYVPKYAHVPVGGIVRLQNGRCMEKRSSGKMVFTRLTKQDCKDN